MIEDSATADGTEAMIECSPPTGDGLSPLEVLLELPRSASEDSLEDFLITVADTICRAAGFATVVLNLFRPAWDDYEVALVVGEEKSVDTLLGTTAPRTAFTRMLTEAEQPVPGVLFLPEESGFWGDLDLVVTPELAPSAEPGAWLAGDGILVFLADSSGAPLGVVSMDVPLSGLRPNLTELRLIRAICQHAESALETARRTAAAADNARALSLLLESSPALSACASAGELFARAADVVVPGLGFERVAAYAREGERLVRCVTRGWEDAPLLPDEFGVAELDALLHPAHEQAGCFLGAAEALLHDADGVERSRRNGSGVTAWQDHCILVPCRQADELLGLMVIEDPVDRLLPSVDRRRALRLLVDQVTAALVALGQRDRLGHLANHDPLTGVRNRRGLDDVVAAHQDVALLVCDLDHFKRVNDHYGHELGDRVLARFGELLREHARDTDVPIRLGGEEFCLVLPNTDREGAVRAAERLREETMERLAELVPGGLTISIGLTATRRDDPDAGVASGVLDARRLLADADRGLYAAKAAGRNRVVFIAGDD